ncbi:MAG: LPS export ABC transporter permease LptF [Proteobacteria bacterium]|nr:LPS export ABC transporter permease LptF [Pseudomonadota bacterium]
MIIQRYIYRELLQKLIWILSLLILVFASNKFVGFLADAAEGHLPADMVFLMLGYKMLATLPKILPVSILIAMLLAFSRMASDRELVILSASGISTVFQIKVVTRFALVFCLLVSVITLYFAPWAERHIHELKERAKQESDISGIKAGQFKEFSQGDRVVYVQNPSPEKGSMEEVFLQVRQEGKLGVLTSDSAHFKIDPKSGNKYVVFNEGRRYVGEPGLLDYQITEYDNYAIQIEGASTNTSGGKISSLPTFEIMVSDNKAHLAEFQWRISLILSCLLLSILAILLMQSHANERRYVPFIIGISIYLIYSNLLGIAQTLLKRDVIPGFIGLWWVHIILIGILLLLFYMPQIRQMINNDDDHQLIPADGSQD